MEARWDGIGTAKGDGRETESKARRDKVAKAGGLEEEWQGGIEKSY